VAQLSWDSLKDRALDYHLTGEKLFQVLDQEGARDRGLWQNVLEQVHFSVEMAMKAAIAKAGIEMYPDSKRAGHDLTAISSCKIAKSGLTLRGAARADRSIQKDFSHVLSSAAWKMHHRYERHPYDVESLRDFIEKYRRVHLWIMRKLVE
jgi:hypothetical protein